MKSGLAHMSSTQLGAYCDFLLRLAGQRRGSVAKHLRQSAQSLLNPWGQL